MIGGGSLELGGRECSTDEIMKALMSQPDESDVLSPGSHRRRALQGPPSGARLIYVPFSATSSQAQAVYAVLKGLERYLKDTSQIHYIALYGDNGIIDGREIPWQPDWMRNKSEDPLGWHGWPEQSDQKEVRMCWKRVKRVVEFVLGVVKEARKDAKRVLVSVDPKLCRVPRFLSGPTQPSGQGDFFLVRFIWYICVLQYCSSVYERILFPIL